MTSTDKLSYENGRPVDVKAPWGRLTGQCWGDEGGRPVVLVHGRQHNSASFSSLIPLLPAGGFLYVCLDLPGHGHSSPISPGLPLDFFHYVYSIKYFVDRLHLKRFIFVGHSLGGMMGTIFCSTFPEMVDRLVLLDSATPFGVPASRCVATARKKIDDVLDLESRVESSPRRRQRRDIALGKIMNGPNGRITAEVGARILERCTRADPSTGLLYFSDDPRLGLDLSPNLTRRQIDNVLTGLACPALLILATESLNRFENRVRIVRDGRNISYGPLESKDVELVVVQGDHFVHINNPQSVAPLVAKFITAPLVKSSL